MHPEKISAGSFDLNKWLYGGYEKDIITMIVGPPASGKTNFVIMAACSQAKKGNKVLFIDTEGGFSVERIKQIAPETHEEILKNFLISKVTSFNDQKKLFVRLSGRIRKEQISLIIVDGMAMLYRLELGDAQKSGSDEKIREVNRDVARQMKLLSEITIKENIPVIITNQVYSEFLSDEDRKKGIKPGVNIVGGDLFKYWSKCIIELKLESGKRKAVLLKHRSMPVKELNFEIKSKGIFRRGWI
ncbi:MAG TPA: DNA repair and recombination protein RadB [Candidatus Pacearchaeota archaeon]|nr:DNA repair and recombination protein RadB [Candidatus Pacearchaeota archaeon]